MDIVERMKRGERLSIGMIHTLPLPGSYDDKYSMKQIVDRAISEAKILESAGFDAVIVENQNDGPLAEGSFDTRKIAAMTIICNKVIENINIPVGIDTCGNQGAAIAIASITGASFVRLSNMVDIRAGSRGITFPNGADMAMYRKRINALNVKIFADIQVKHTYPVIKEISLEESAKWVMANKADVIIVTGAETGKAAEISEFARVKNIVSIPVIAGSGVSIGNVARHYDVCDGCIVGSALKEEGNLMNPVKEELAYSFISSVNEWKRGSKK